MDLDIIRDLGILIALIGASLTVVMGFLGQNIFIGVIVLILGGILILLSLLMSESSSIKKTRIRRKRREVKKPALYRIAPKTEQKMPGENILYTVSITNLLPEKIDGKVSITVPQGWHLDNTEHTFGSIKREETANVNFEVDIPKDAQLGYIYKITINVSFLEYSQELSAVVELLSQEDELLTIEEDEQIMKALEEL